MFFNIILTFGLILIGSGVHIQEQSLVCPDWPLCYGQMLPRLQQAWWTTLTHRLLATLVGILTLATSMALHFKKEFFRVESLRWSWWSAVLVVLQGFLGALTVKYKLPTLISTAHLVFSAVFLCSLWGTYLSFSERKVEKFDFLGPRAINWSWGILLAVFLQIVLGGFIRHSGAARACGLGSGHLLLCFDQIANSLTLWPTLQLAKWNMAHRLFAMIVGGAIMVGTYQIRKSLSKNLNKKFHIGDDCLLLIFFLIVQLLIGFWSVSRGLATIPRLLHLLFAMMTLLFCFGIHFKLQAIRQLLRRDHHPGFLRDMIDLMKPRLTALVVLTSLIGLLLAPDTIHFLDGLIAMVGIAALVAGACTLNCYLERELDKKMQRTCDRPLPSGRLSSAWALGLSIILILFSLGLLAAYVNFLTTFLGLLAVILYLYVYTPLKQKSIFSLFIGAIPGALPPVLGWTSVMGSLDPLPLVLFAIIFIWQIPHFIAIGLYRKEDYQRAEFKIIPVEYGHQSARWQIFIYSLLLVIVSLLPGYLQLVRKGHFYYAFCLGVLFCSYALQGVIGQGNKFDEKRWARKYFWATLGYLPLLLIALVAFKQSL